MCVCNYIFFQDDVDPEHIGTNRSKTMPPQSSPTRPQLSRKVTLIQPKFGGGQADLTTERIKNAKTQAEKAMKVCTLIN